MTDFAFDQNGPWRFAASKPRSTARADSAVNGLCTVQAWGLQPARKILDRMSGSILDADRRQAKAVWGPKVH